MPRDGSRLTYTLNIIDTPGFGDTRGIERDQRIIDQIRHLFSGTGAKGLFYLDAVCFTVKAPDARLTVSQRYIFSSIMSLFGKDIESNICTMITFADGSEAPVLASLKEASIPFGSTFTFNNAALFAENKTPASSALLQMFWDMGCTSFKKFFDEIHHFETRSILQSKAVLQERDQLKKMISDSLPHVKTGLTKLSQLQTELDLFKKHKNDIEQYKNFEYEFNETRLTIVKLDPGHRATNCHNCNFTCHDDCDITDDNALSNCSAMKSGKCTMCSKKCKWNDHRNDVYKFESVVKHVRKTYDEMKMKYKKAKEQKLNHESLIKELLSDVKDIVNSVKKMTTTVNRCKSNLKKIALRPDQLSTVEHLDLLIQTEKHEKQLGHKSRIEMLCELINMAEFEKDCEHFYATYDSTKQEIVSIGIPSSTLSIEDENSD